MRARDMEGQHASGAQVIWVAAAIGHSNQSTPVTKQKRSSITREQDEALLFASKNTRHRELLSCRGMKRFSSVVREIASHLCTSINGLTQPYSAKLPQ